mmetsp:Transcript_46633/g.110888  ORF Transcript_46633/g.110888 Transcript_46633/m.110888 type:complete len:331 (-) Transcript_46633:116-1108(-)
MRIQQLMYDPNVGLEVSAFAGVVSTHLLCAADKDLELLMRDARAIAAQEATIFTCNGAGELHALATGSKTWEPLKHKHGVSSAESAVVCGGKLYIIGADDFETTLEVYSPTSGAWKRLASPPLCHRGSAAAALDGSIYLAGGLGGGTFTATLQRYDVSSGRWEERPHMPTARAWSAAARLAGNLYVVGGATGPADLLPVLERFEPEAASTEGKWTRLPPLPRGRAGCAATAVAGSLWVLGGKVGRWEQLSGTVERFDPISSCWEAVATATLSPQRGPFMAAQCAGFVYLVGEAPEGSVAASRFQLSVGRWERLPEPPGTKGAVVGALMID